MGTGIWKVAGVFALAVLLVGCRGDDNDKPVYGEGTGLPVNCRAYVQVAVDGYRAKRHTAEETMAGLERNCGADGGIWKKNRG
ncbi:kynureninase [Janthinobacterium lividum]|nr:kynureninase [Janthinobacterium lividum]